MVIGSCRTIRGNDDDDDYGLFLGRRRFKSPPLEREGNTSVNLLGNLLK